MELSEFARSMAYAQAEGSGLQGLSRLLMQKIGKTVIITDSFGKVVSGHSPLEQEIVIEEKIILPSCVQNGEEYPMSGMTVIRGKKYHFTIWSLHEQKVMGYLLILPGEIVENQKPFVKIACNAAMVEMARKKELYESIKVYKDDFIRDILFNNYDGFNKASSAGRMWGWDFSLPHIVIVLHIKMEENRIDRIRHSLEDKLISCVPSCITGKVGKQLVILYPVSKDNQNNWKEKVNEIYKEIVIDFSEIQFSIGVGKLYPSATMLYRSYQQAKVALELGEITKHEGVAFFDELGAVRLFYNQSEQELEEFINEILGPIIEYDEGKDNSLLVTLWHYFQANTNINDATNNLYIHVNTLRYRLKKVEELLGKSLDDMETKFNVYGALKIAAMLGKI